MRALRSLGACDAAKLAAVSSGMLQFEALGRGLWVYGIFTAIKSGPHNHSAEKEEVTRRRLHPLLQATASARAKEPAQR